MGKLIKFYHGVETYFLTLSFAIFSFLFSSCPFTFFPPLEKSKTEVCVRNEEIGANLALFHMR